MLRYIFKYAHTSYIFVKKFFFNLYQIQTKENDEIWTFYFDTELFIQNFPVCFQIMPPKVKKILDAILKSKKIML